MCARAILWRDAGILRVSFSASETIVGVFTRAWERITEAIISEHEKQRLTIRRVALGLRLVFNVASQKNAISDGFCPFLSSGKTPGKKPRQQVCMTHLFFGTVRKVYLVRSI